MGPSPQSQPGSVSNQSLPRVSKCIIFQLHQDVHQRHAVHHHPHTSTGSASQYVNPDNHGLFMGHCTTRQRWTHSVSLSHRLSLQHGSCAPNLSSSPRPLDCPHGADLILHSDAGGQGPRPRDETVEARPSQSLCLCHC